MKVMIGEAERLDAKLLAFVLEEAGYQVVTAGDGSAIFQAITSDQPDLMLLDVRLPDANGFDICRRIRRNSDVPIILLSARGQVDECVQGLQLGADDYLAKPYEPLELLARIEAVLRRCMPDPVAGAVRLNQGDLTLDTIEQRVEFADGRIRLLTPVECRLLNYLIQHVEQVLSSAQICTWVWNNKGSDSRVAVYVRRLRTKIESDPAHPQRIVTVEPLGYSFKAQPVRLSYHQDMKRTL